MPCSAKIIIDRRPRNDQIIPGRRSSSQRPVPSGWSRPLAGWPGPGRSAPGGQGLRRLPEPIHELYRYHSQPIRRRRATPALSPGPTSAAVPAGRTVRPPVGHVVVEHLFHVPHRIFDRQPTVGAAQLGLNAAQSSLPSNPNRDHQPRTPEPWPLGPCRGAPRPSSSRRANPSPREEAASCL